MRNRVIALASMAALFSCGSPSEVRAPVLSGAAEPPSSYPLQFPPLDDEDLDRRTAEAMSKTPGWGILLDPFGMLSTATCTACAKTRPADSTAVREERDRIEAFLVAHRALLALDAPGVVKKYDLPHGMLFQQVTPSGIAANLTVTRSGGGVTISGHMWPNLPAPGPWLPDVELQAKLDALIPHAAPLTHRYSRIVRKERSPLEVHEVACSWTTEESAPLGADVRTWNEPDAHCVDARTGEDLSPFVTTVTVRARNGKVTSRTIERSPTKQ